MAKPNDGVEFANSTIYPLSFSRMQVFEQCELRFEHQYVLRDCRDEGSDASRYGNRVHEAFEHYLKDGTPLTEETVKWQSMLDKLKTYPGEQFYELELAVRKDKSPCDWEDPDCWNRGIADIAVVNGTKGFAGDWKTGKPKDDTQQLKLMAAHMFEQFLELQTVATKYFWLLHPTAPSQTIVYTRDMLPDLWAHFERKATRIDAAMEQGVFNAKPSGLCGWCPVYDRCSYARRRR